MSQGIQEHHFDVPRSARYYTLGDAASARDVWIVCHGYGQLAGKFITYFQPIAAPGRLIVAPEALSRYYTNHAAREVGATWMTSEDRLTDIKDYVRYLDLLVGEAVRPDAAARLRVLGFSQGTATVSRWVSLGQVQPSQVMLWGGSLPPDLDLAAAAPRLRAADLVLVIGERDEFATPARIAEEERRLAEADIPYRLVRFAGGHRLDKDTLKQLAEGA